MWGYCFQKEHINIHIRSCLHVRQFLNPESHQTLAKEARGEHHMHSLNTCCSLNTCSVNPWLSPTLTKEGTCCQENTTCTCLAVRTPLIPSCCRGNSLQAFLGMFLYPVVTNLPSSYEHTLCRRPQGCSPTHTVLTVNPGYGRPGSMPSFFLLMAFSVQAFQSMVLLLTMTTTHQLCSTVI